VNLLVNNKIINYFFFFPNVVDIAIAFAALAVNAADGDVTDDTQSAGDVMTSLLL